MKQNFKYAVYLIAAIAISSASAGSYVDFFRAVNVDDADTVGGLLARGFDPNAANEAGQTGLVLALRDGSPKVAALLLAQPQIKVDAANASDETPLMMAALRGDIGWTQRLLDRGAAIQRPGWTPLHYAASGPEPRVVALLLDRGAAIDAPSPNGSTPLMMAARYGDQRSAVLLMARGAHAGIRNAAGLTAADFARAGGRDALAATLDQAAR
jgi:ankyrin repeat protein